MKSWKTSLCGIAGVVLVGAAQTPACPPWASHLLTVLAGVAPSVGLLFARDYDKSSEDHGVTTVEIKSPTPQ